MFTFRLLVQLLQRVLRNLNDRLSQARADVVANYLKGRGVIVDEATGKGVQGVTSNRLAVVYVK